MNDQIIFQASISRADFDGFVSMLRLMGKTYAVDKGDLDRLWECLKQAPCKFDDIKDSFFDEHISREQLLIILIAAAINAGGDRIAE